MRDEEEFCKQSFDRYLTSRLGLHTEWRPGPDPPDYFVAIEGSTFAVEVTQLFGQLRDADGRHVDDMQYQVSTNRLCAKIQRLAIQRGTLRGLYVLRFVGAFRHWRQAAPPITGRALAYVASTSTPATASPRVIFAEAVEQTSTRGSSDEALLEHVGSQFRHGSCSIHKLADAPDAIVCSADAPDRWMWEGQVLPEACRLLQRAITTKKAKLANIVDPKVLLVVHEWPMERGWIYKGCASQLSSLDYFHSVFVVDTQGEGYFLHTRDPRWGSCP
jgi:hypothetical protein